MLLQGVLALAALVLPLTCAQTISKTARCGPQFGLTCQGSSFGNCTSSRSFLVYVSLLISTGCSQYSYCGSSINYCGIGCQNGWGSCNTSPSLTTLVRSASTRTTMVASPSPMIKVTRNARCGKGFGFTCQGSQWGNCCSQ
jgi:hypothetical protein